MIIDVIMPKLGESITEGTILQWRKKVGESIKKDEILLEIGTDKVDSDIPSPAGGVVAEILSNPNDVVPVEHVIARIDSEGKTLEEVEEVETAPPEVAAPEVKEEIAPEVTPSVAPSKRRSFYTPLVRSIARREGVTEVELASIPGTGKGGRVAKHDILAYLEKRVAVAPPIEAPVSAEISLEEKTVELDRVRQLIADHMRKSLDTAAHTHVVSECDVSGIVEYLTAQQTQFQKQEQFKLTYTPFFILAAVKTIQDFPLFNASLDGNRIVYAKNINMGLAVAAEKGLMVPVVKKCEELNFLGVCRKVNDLTVRTREGRIGPDELQGSTISLTNYGVFGNLLGTPIINQPNVGIIGVGAIRKRPVVRETEQGDAIVIRSMTYLSLGFDHRLIDGALAGQFLQRMAGYLESMDTSTLL